MDASPTRGWPLRVLLAALLLMAGPPAGADVPVPQLTARVTDLTGTLTSGQQAALEQKLAGIEARNTAQIAVLLVPTTQPETVEQYAVNVFEKWKLGRKGVDNGVLLVVAKNDRKLRIEVGYGLEGAIPDALAKRIIDEEIVPRFKQGDFHGGIDAGADRIARLIGGEIMPPPRQAHPPEGNSRNFTDLLFYGFIATLILGGVLRAIFGRLLGSGIIGVAAGMVAYMLAGIAAAVIVAVVAFLVTLINYAGHGRGWSSRGGWSPGGSSWSSGGGGFGGGGGGFGGGGGSSGGGGASGSW
jgi:uncharacterized protein